MDYYHRRSMACSRIKSMVSSKASQSQIELNVMSEFGLSAKFVREYLKVLASNNLLHFVDGEIYYD